MTRLVLYQLYYYQATTMFVGEQNLASLGEWYIVVNLDLLVFRLIPHAIEAAIDQDPLSFVKMKITYWQLVFSCSLFIGYYETVDMPHVEGLLVIDHEAIFF